MSKNLNYNNTLASNGLQIMFDMHRPKLWIFGHYHQDFDDVIKGTRFVCLNELKTITI